MKKINVVLVFLSLLATSTFAQVIPCHTDENQEEYLQQHPELRQVYQDAHNHLMESASKQKKSGTTGTILTIPVVFHIIYNTPYDNISKAQILDGLRILNEDFRRMNPDASSVRPVFQSRAADTEIEFVLAKKDENGNCTDGITRIKSPLSVMASPRNDVKSKTVQWDPSKYLNIWVVNSITSSGGSGLVLGYANFPWMAASTDGIVIRHDALGVIGTATYDGRTLTHEVGHYLGLLHTFQGGCNGSGDGIADTPPVSSANYGCRLNANSCVEPGGDLPDMIENFMDYSDGACMNTYTAGQKNVMRSTLLFNGRSNLSSNNNLISTGVINPPACLPQASFELYPMVVCEGETVNFTDLTEDGEPTSYQWSLPGTNSGTAAVANPSVVYTQRGSYDVTLTVSNAAGSSTHTIKNAISVKPRWTKYQAAWNEGFENQATIDEDLFFYSTYDSVGFKVNNQVSHSGTNSLFLDNYNAVEPQDRDVFYSPLISTIFAKDISLNFNYAYASRANTNIEVLKVYISTDCGSTWNVLRQYATFTLRTVTQPVTSAFVPTGSNQWKKATISLNSFEDKGPVMFKFEFEADGGNNLYIDNINISSSNIGLEQQEFENALSVFPNPASDQINIHFGQATAEDILVNITDMSGKTVAQQKSTSGNLELQMDLNGLSTGVYIINISSGSLSAIKKLVIE